MKIPTLTFDDFVKLDIRVGDVKDAEIVAGSKKLITLQVALGPDYGLVEILAGVGEYYQPEDLKGRKFLFVANLEPRPMMGHVSNGMLLAADVDGKPIIIPVSDEPAPGTRIC